MTQIALLTRNLLGVSPVSAAARQAGKTLRVARAAEELATLEPPAELVLIDLAEESLDPAAVVAAARGRLASARLIAFGPHVDTRRLDQAREAGCDLVLSRGEFTARMAELLA